MLTALLLGIILGFTLSIPPGPLSVAVTKKCLQGHTIPAFMTGLGAAAMDICYNLIAAFASSAIVVTLSNLFVHNRWLSLLFQILCVIVLVVLGIRYIREKHDVMHDRALIEKDEAQEEKAKKLGHGSPFFVGVLIAFTNLASPTFLPSMIAVISYLHAEGLLGQNIDANVLYSVGFGFGTTIWFVVLLQLLVKHRRKLSPNFITSIYRFAGGTFILFALALAYNITVNMNWASILSH